jgi:ribonuclease HII
MQFDIFAQAKDTPDVPYLAIEQGLWSSGHEFIAGVDEVGRGPLAGPVVAAACILPKNVRYPAVQDSKALTEEQREAIYEELINDKRVIWAVHIIDHETVDTINILRSTLLAMKEAVQKLSKTPQFVLIDGRDSPPLSIPHLALIKGDSRSQSIAAASIIAKVTRDRIMDAYDEEYPRYGFKKHKGYGTSAHLKAIEQHGLCPIHRRSFALIAKKAKIEENFLF